MQHVRKAVRRETEQGPVDPGLGGVGGAKQAAKKGLNCPPEGGN